MLLALLMILVTPSAGAPADGSRAEPCDFAADSVPASRAGLPKLREWTSTGRPPVSYAGLRIGRDWRGGLLCNDLVPADGCQRWQVEVAVAGGRAALREPGTAHTWVLVVTSTSWGRAVPPPPNAPLDVELGRARCSLAPVLAAKGARTEKSGLRVAELMLYYPVDAVTLVAMANASTPKLHLAGGTITVQKDQHEDLRALVHAGVPPEQLVDWSRAVAAAASARGLAAAPAPRDTVHRALPTQRWLGWLDRDTTAEGRPLSWVAYAVLPGVPPPALAGDTLRLVSLPQGDAGRAVVRAKSYRVSGACRDCGRRTAAWVLALEPVGPLPADAGTLAVVNGAESWTGLTLENRAAVTSFGESYGLLLDRQLETQPAAVRAATRRAALARLDSLAAPGFAGPDGEVFVLYVPPLDQAGAGRLPAMLFLVDGEGGIRHRMTDGLQPVGLTNDGGGSGVTLWLAGGSLRWAGTRWMESRQ